MRVSAAEGRPRGRSHGGRWRRDLRRRHVRAGARDHRLHARAARGARAALSGRRAYAPRTPRFEDSRTRMLAAPRVEACSRAVRGAGRSGWRLRQPAYRRLGRASPRSSATVYRGHAATRGRRRRRAQVLVSCDAGEFCFHSCCCDTSSRMRLRSTFLRFTNAFFRPSPSRQDTPAAVRLIPQCGLSYTKGGE
jgi:hypothetical protein